MNPITGQGGNTAIESAAALANSLVHRLDVVRGHLSDVEVDGILRETQAVREDRARLSVEFASNVQKVEPMESPIVGILVRLMLPLLSCDMRLERHSGIIVEAVRVEKLPVSGRAHFVPYVDELPAKPMANTKLPKLVIVLCLLVLFYMAMDVERFLNLQTTSLGTPIARTYTRNWVLKKMLVSFAGIFSSPVTSEDMSRQIQTGYFMAILIPATLIWTVERHRRGNNQTILGRFITW